MAFIGVFFLMSATSVKAESFWVTGTIQRMLSDVHYGECMIYLSSSIGHGCPGRWVSLDCKGIYQDEGVGNRSYATAVVAASMKKQVSVYVNSEQKHNGYCVTRRLDIIF